MFPWVAAARQPRAVFRKPVGLNRIGNPNGLNCNGNRNLDASRSHARLRAFPPRAVLGPCFSTGLRSFPIPVVTPVYGRPLRRRRRRPVNEPDNPFHRMVNFSRKLVEKARRRGIIRHVVGCGDWPCDPRLQHSFAEKESRNRSRAGNRRSGVSPLYVDGQAENHPKQRGETPRLLTRERLQNPKAGMAFSVIGFICRVTGPLVIAVAIINLIGTIFIRIP